MEDRKSQLIATISSNLILQFITAVCGFILPPLIVETFDDEEILVNVLFRKDSWLVYENLLIKKINQFIILDIPIMFFFKGKL